MIKPTFPSNTLARKYPEHVISDEDQEFLDKLGVPTRQTRVYTQGVNDALRAEGRILERKDIPNVVRTIFGPFEGLNDASVNLAKVKGEGWVHVPHDLVNDVWDEVTDF